MRRSAAIYILFFLLSHLNADYINDYLRYQVKVEGYERIDPNYYFILAAKDGVVDDLLTYIYEGTSQTDIRAFGALAVLLGGDNTLLPFNEVAKIVETIEAKDPIDFNRLRASYQIAALYNTDESLALLKKRMKPNFSQFRADGIPSYTTRRLQRMLRFTASSQSACIPALRQKPFCDLSSGILAMPITNSYWIGHELH